MRTASAAARCRSQIERGVDAEGAGLEIRVLELALQRRRSPGPRNTGASADCDRALGHD